MTLDLQHALASTFSAHLNTTFRLGHGSAVTDLDPIDVADGSAGRHVNVSLVLRGPQQPAVPQQIYPFEHDRWDTEIRIIDIALL